MNCAKIAETPQRRLIVYITVRKDTKFSATTRTCSVRRYCCAEQRVDYLTNVSLRVKCVYSRKTDCDWSHGPPPPCTYECYCCNNSLLMLLTQDEYHEMIKEADINGDGAVDFKGWCMLMQC